MIKKLKRKFTVLATVSMLVLMTVLILIMNLANYGSLVSENDAILEVLAEASDPGRGGAMPPDGRGGPDGRGDLDPSDDDWDWDDWDERFGPRGLSPEIPYESRYFTVWANADGDIIAVDLSRIVSVDDASAREYAGKALASSRSKGFAGNFRYLKISDEGGTRIIFLDCGRKLSSFHKFMWTSIITGFAGCVIVFLIFLFAAGRIVRPIAESYEKQKSFITDAGHEIKTPITIIRANADLMEEDFGENECLTDIRNQTERLADLTNKLVYLSRMEEAGSEIVKMDFPVSELVSEIAQSFTAVAAAQRNEYEINVQPDIMMNGAPDEIRQLSSILIENAMKYTTEGGQVGVELSKQKKQIVLSVYNDTENVIPDEELPHLFDRFYRADKSRNSETGGHGIGLSIAKVITEAHGGKISAATRDGKQFVITATFPQ